MDDTLILESKLCKYKIFLDIYLYSVAMNWLQE